LAITNVRLLDPASGLDVPGGLVIEGGHIADFGPNVPGDAPADDFELIDGGGACLAPGLVDARVQLGEPGAEHKETFASGSAAAAAGGVTTLACLPDTKPPVDDPAMVEFVARRARRVRGVKVHPYAALTQGLRGEELTEVGLLCEAGAVGLTDAGRAVADSGVMRRALMYARRFDALIVQHPEDPALAGGVMNAGELATRLGLPGIPAVAEVILIERDLRLVELTGGRLHFAHVSTAAGVEAIRRAKARGLPITAETTPAHLILNELAVHGYRTYAKLSPPLRSEQDRLALVEGVVDGTLDIVVSDHCPQDQDSKRVPFARAEFGAVGLETLLPVGLLLVRQGRLSLLQLLDRLTRRPAELLGLEAGRLRRGAPADLVLFDPDAPWQVREEDLHSLARNTPFEGMLVQGRVLRTWVDGRTVFVREG
jgi:dihydroorotase